MNLEDIAMLTRSSICTLMLLLIASVSHSTDVYISVDDKGNRVFSDQPTKESRKHKVKEISIIPSIKVPEQAPSKEPAEEVLYQSLNLIAPTSGTSLTRDYLGNFKITAQLMPNLQPSDETVLMINGQEVEAGSNLSWQRLNADRGEYTIQVLVRDKESGKQKITSDSITLYVQR